MERRDLDNSEDRLTAWLTNISVAILCNDQAAQQEMFKVEHKDLCQSFEGQPIRDIELAFFDLFRAFLLGESDKQRQIQFMKAVIPILTDENLIEACGGNDYWPDFYQWLRFPLYSIISVCWGHEETSLDEAVIAAIDANYEFYSEIEPRHNGRPTGKESLDLLAREAMFHTITTAFLTAHYRRTGQTVSFDSPYVPQWLIKGEGLTREEVLANPPVFDLEHVLGNQ
ncbi:Imm49 family immunity protein [Vibrio sp. S9_S30]|uniref:Imm49 family immunity protein n=1 Tax=Vibrio sp. S9_S30 TaxID=2720226 RepID=UPI0031394348